MYVERRWFCVEEQNMYEGINCRNSANILRGFHPGWILLPASGQAYYRVISARRSHVQGKL
jgi:hypothetical protein